MKTKLCTFELLEKLQFLRTNYKDISINLIVFQTTVIKKKARKNVKRIQSAITSKDTITSKNCASGFSNPLITLNANGLNLLTLSLTVKIASSHNIIYEEECRK